MVGGVRDAVQNTVLEPINSLASWLEEQFPLGSIEVGSSGLRHSDESRDFSLPNVPEGETVSGDIVRHVTQFLDRLSGPWEVGGHEVCTRGSIGHGRPSRRAGRSG